MGSKTAVTDGQSTTFRAKVLCAERGDDSPAANFGKPRETVGRKAMGPKGQWFRGSPPEFVPRGTNLAVSMAARLPDLFASEQCKERNRK